MTTSRPGGREVRRSDARPWRRIDRRLRARRAQVPRAGLYVLRFVQRLALSLVCICPRSPLPLHDDSVEVGLVIQRPTNLATGRGRDASTEQDARALQVTDDPRAHTEITPARLDVEQ